MWLRKDDGGGVGGSCGCGWSGGDGRGLSAMILGREFAGLLS